MRAARRRRAHRGRAVAVSRVPDPTKKIDARRRGRKADFNGARRRPAHAAQRRQHAFPRAAPRSLSVAVCLRAGSGSGSGRQTTAAAGVVVCGCGWARRRPHVPHAALLFTVAARPSTSPFPSQQTTISTLHCRTRASPSSLSYSLLG
jgi:hypothetical protein